MKYLIRNDIKELKKRPLKIFAIILLMELLFQRFIPGDDIYNIILGRNLNDIQDYMAVLFFILNSAFYVYISLHITTRDLTYNLDNIFLRIKEEKFILEKIICLILSIFILRTVEYVIVLPLILKFNITIIMVIKMIIKDILYYLNISIMTIFLRELSYKINNMYMFLIIIILMIIPKNFDNSYLYYILGIIIFSILSIMVMKNNSKSIIEKEGENK